jgi:hypothetical protein
MLPYIAQAEGYTSHNKDQVEKTSVSAEPWKDTA